MKDGWYQATTHFYWAGLFVEKGIVVNTAPIIKWASGLRIEDFTKRVEKIGGKVLELKTEFEDKNSDEFGTPDYLYLPLHEEFQFTVDAAASAQNTKCELFYSKEDDGLEQDYFHDRVWCNPPYCGRGTVEKWIRKAHGVCCVNMMPAELWVLLVPTKTEQDWFYELRNFFEVRYIRGRIKFVGGESSARDSHMLIIFRSWKWTENWSW